MTFSLQPLEFPLEAKGDWIGRELTVLNDARTWHFAPLVHDFALLVHIWKGSKSHCICGVRGMGKTSLLNKMAFSVNARAVDLAIGPLSFPSFTRGGGYYGLESELYRVLRELTYQFPNRIKLPDFSNLPRTFDQFPALFEKLPYNTSPNPHFLIILDDLDSLSVEDRTLILGDLKKLMTALSPRVRVLCAGNFLDDEFPSAVAPLDENMTGYTLGRFSKDEMEEFFAKITSHFGITFDPTTRHGRDKRKVFKGWSQSIPYFLQAMTLNTLKPGYPSYMDIDAYSLQAFTIQMSSALISPFLEPLSQLKGEARGKAQEIVNGLLQSEGVVAAANVDWNDPVVRNLWRWGIIWRNKKNHNMVWAPLLEEWFKKAGPVIDAEAPERESEQAEQKAKKGKKAKASPPRKTKTVDEKPVKSRRSGARSIKKGPPARRAVMKGSPPQGPKATERYVNLWFTRVRGADQSLIPKQRMLPLHQQVFLQVNIAPFDKRSILEDAQPFVSEAEIARRFPETVGRPVPLEVVLFSQEKEFFIAPEDRTQRVDLLPGKPTTALYFPLRPLRVASSRLRVCIFYRNHLLQSLAVTVMVSPTPMRMPKAQRARVEVTFSAGFSHVQALPPRALWLGINHAADGTHTLNMKDSGNALSRNLGGKLENALTNAREALRKVSFIEKKDEEGNVVKEYRFQADNSPKAAGEMQQKKRFKEDLTILAEAGMSLYMAIFGQPPVAEEKAVLPLVRAMEETLRNEQVIQIARLKSMEDIWPWAMIYDSYIDPGNVKTVCTAFRGDDGRALPYAEGVHRCRHRDPVTRLGHDDSVVCPYSFWGFKHILEQPVHAGGKQAFSDLILEIKIGLEAILQMPLENKLSQSETAHVNQMRGLHFKPLASLEEIKTALNLQPHVLYFFCHGKYDSQHEPYLQVGTNESLRPALLHHLALSWASSHGLVFINGCHTVELEPKNLTPIMSPFVNAGASGIIGTEISVTTALAREFAHEFFKRFLLGQGFPSQRVGQIIKDLRLNLLMKFNPLGLVYTPYCSADLRVVR